MQKPSFEGLFHLTKRTLLMIAERKRGNGERGTGPKSSQRFTEVSGNLQRFLEEDIQKNPRVRKIVCTQFRRRKWLHQFYGRLEKCVLSAGKSHVHKITGFREGVFWFCFGGGEVLILFLWAQGSLEEDILVEMAKQVLRSAQNCSPSVSLPLYPSAIWAKLALRIFSGYFQATKIHSSQKWLRTYPWRR